MLNLNSLTHILSDKEYDNNINNYDFIQQIHSLEILHKTFSNCCNLMFSSLYRKVKKLLRG